jgi:hypothetical protein
MEVELLNSISSAHHLCASAREGVPMPARRLEKARLGLRLKSREHLPIASIDLGENFVKPRKRSP